MEHADRRPGLRLTMVRASHSPDGRLHLREVPALDQYTHKTVNHGAGEYALPVGTSTNQIESFISRRLRPEMMLSELPSRFPELDA